MRMHTLPVKNIIRPGEVDIFESAVGGAAPLTGTAWKAIIAVLLRRDDLTGHHFAVGFTAESAQRSHFGCRHVPTAGKHPHIQAGEIPTDRARQTPGRGSG